MKYLIIVLALILVTSCSNTKYTGVVTERFYESAKFNTGGHYTYAEFHVAVKDTQGKMHLVEVDEDVFLNVAVGDTIKFKD